MNFFCQTFAYSKIMRTFATHLRNKSTGEMAEWSIAAVLKTVELRGSGGSNPSLSAISAENQQIAKQTPSFTPKNVKLGVFVLFKMKRIFAQKKGLNKTKPTKRTIKSCSFRWLLYQFNCLTAAMYQSNMCFGMDTVLKTPPIR